ncbi:MAG: hypothetical protein H0V65_02700, partial [Chitinophagales bacterium]|nr:hypothetical protein [Chitinophagales bacterium]
MVFRRMFMLMAFSCITIITFGQSVITGVINNYWEVYSVDFCNNRVSLPVIATGLATGNKVLLIQMTGAAIDTSDAITYGTVTDYLKSGNYELLTVSNISNNIIT